MKAKQGWLFVKLQQDLGDICQGSVVEPATSMKVGTLLYYVQSRALKWQDAKRGVLFVIPEEAVIAHEE